MFNFSRTKIFTILAVCVWGIYGAIPHMNYSLVERANDAKKEAINSESLDLKKASDIKSWPSWLSSKIVNLGLDLRGGAHLLVEVSVEDVYAEKIDSIWIEVRKALRAVKSEVGSFRRKDSDEDTLKVEIQNPEAINLARNEVNKLNRSISSVTAMSAKTFDLITEKNLLTLSLSSSAKKQVDDQTMAQSLEIIRRRVDEAGTREPSIQRQGQRRILVQVPGIGSAEELLELIGQTAKLSFHEVVSKTSGSAEIIRFDQIKLPDASDLELFYILKKRPVVSGNELKSAQPSFDQNNRPAVNFQFNPSGGRKFGAYTKENIGLPFAIALDGEVISAPIIQSHIPGGAGIITGNFSVEESNRLAILLRAGALPAEILVLEQRTIGPELGADSIKAGKVAAMLGGVLVVIFMILSYGVFGLFANIALTLNIALLFSLLGIVGATLTLPGIAGIVLTLGMAVDANVLVFERIREELANGKTPVKAVELGYEKALTSIIDANVTTMIAAVLLFIFGSGPIRGFSITLAVGIVTSVFTAIYFTRLLIFFYFSVAQPKEIKI